MGTKQKLLCLVFFQSGNGICKPGYHCKYLNIYLAEIVIENYIIITQLSLDVSPCRMNPCKNGGRCIDGMSGFRWSVSTMHYYCLCPPPFTGAHCEGKLIFVICFL